MVSKASDDLPLPLRPVTTTSLSRGICSVRFLRLCSRAPPILMNSLLMLRISRYAERWKLRQAAPKAKPDLRGPRRRRRPTPTWERGLSQSAARGQAEALENNDAPLGWRRAARCDNSRSAPAKTGLDSGPPAAYRCAMINDRLQTKPQLTSHA